MEVNQQPFVVTVNCGSAAPITAGKPFTCTVSATGGTAPYQGTGNFTVTQPVKGTFTESFTVRDANGKSAIASTQVTVVQQPFVATVNCGSTGITAGKPFTCTVSATGGTAPYQGTGTFTVTQPVKGTFTESFTVRDANGKSAVASTTVTVVQQPFVATVNCGTGQTAGKPFTCTVSATGGTAPYQGTGTFTVTQPVKGTFTESFTVTDANGKSTVASTVVRVSGQPLVVDFSFTCSGGFVITFTATASGGTTPYSFSWNFGDSNTGTGNPVTHTYTGAGPFTVTLTLTDANGTHATKSKSVTPCGNVLTDTSFCPLDQNGFRIIFIMDPANPSAFRLVSTNPGQFYDNVFDTGTPLTPVTLSIKVPYPFVTNGAFPIQVSSSFNVVGGCFQPAFDQNANFAVSTSGGNLSPSGHPVILLSDYGSTPTVGVTTTTVTVTGNIPATGLVYVTIHLEYGLKGTSGWTKVGTGPTVFPAFNSGIGGGITINDPQSYAFSFTDGTPSSTSPVSHNVWKKDPGFAGVITDLTTGARIAGATVNIYDSTHHYIGSATTDNDGVYLFVYKYTGSKTTFTVVAAISMTNYQSVAVQMQSNKLVLLNFQF